MDSKQRLEQDRYERLIDELAGTMPGWVEVEREVMQCEDERVSEWVRLSGSSGCLRSPLGLQLFGKYGRPLVFLKATPDGKRVVDDDAKAPVWYHARDGGCDTIESDDQILGLFWDRIECDDQILGLFLGWHRDQTELRRRVEAGQLCEAFQAQRKLEGVDESVPKAQ